MRQGKGTAEHSIDSLINQHSVLKRFVAVIQIITAVVVLIDRSKLLIQSLISHNSPLLLLNLLLHHSRCCHNPFDTFGNAVYI